jgi:hypothetical protein
MENLQRRQTESYRVDAVKMANKAIKKVKFAIDPKK